MKIWRVCWYNKDDYGMMDNVTVIVKVDGDGIKATEIAKDYINGLYMKFDFSRYDNLEVVDISNTQILSASINNMI